MADQIIRMLAKDAPVKACAITAKALVERARQIHKTLPLATAALGRSLMACSMLGNQLKEAEGAVTLRIKGDGPMGGVTVVSDSQGNVRGYVQDGTVELPLKAPGKLDVGSAIGATGTLTIIKDIGLKEPYVGTIQLVSGEIADDVAAYFVESEQIPTVCALGVLVDTDQSVLCAGGYFIQLLPGAEDDVITRIEQGVARMGVVTNALRGGMDIEAMLREILQGFDMERVACSPVEYRCYCSEERVERALISLGGKELSNLIAEQGNAEITCQFCDKVYGYGKAELQALLEKIEGGK